MARLGAGQDLSSNEFEKAIYAIRENNQTKGMACAVFIEGQNKDSVLLVTADTWKSTEPISGCQLHRYSSKKKKFEDYQLNPSRITQRGHFSVVLCDGRGSSFTKRSLPKKCLSGQQLKRDFRVYTIYQDKFTDLELRYSNGRHNLIVKNLHDLRLCGSPIIDEGNSEKYLVGVLTTNTRGNPIPHFLSDGVLEQPAFNKHPKDPQTPREGESITFSSDANGIPEPTFSWFKGESAVTANNRISLTEHNKKLIITNVNRTDSGKYRCVATNSVRTVYSNAATLIVHYQPEFTIHPKSDHETVREGSYVNFLSDAHGVPEPEFSWIKDGTPLDEGDRISFLGRNKQLRITGVKKEDSGKYQCVASNEVNTTVKSDPAMLKVEEHRRERSFIDGPVGYTRKEMAEELERYKDEATEDLPGGYMEESMAGPSGKYREKSVAEAPGGYREERMEKAPGGYRVEPMGEAFSVAEVPGRHRERLKDEEPKRFKEEQVAEAPTGRHKEDPVAEPSGRHKEEPAVEEPPVRHREHRQQPVAEAPGRNKEEAKRTFEADMTFSDGSRHWDISLRVAGNSWTDDTAWAQQCNKALEELGRNAVTIALESSGRQVINMRPTKSVLVELRCYTKESFLSFMDDLESRKVKRRLEEEFAEVGYKGELEVTIVNEKDVYRALDQIRAQMAMTKIASVASVSNMGVVGEVLVTIADTPKTDVAFSTVSTAGEDTKTMCVLMEDDIPLDGPRNVRDQSEEATSVSVADLHESNQDPGIQDVAALTPSSEGEDTKFEDGKGEISAGAAAPDSREDNIATSAVSSDEQEPDWDSREPPSVLLVGLSEKQETGLDYTSEQLNFLRLCYLAFVVVAQGLRMIFKRLWDNQYRKSRFGEWMDTPRNGKDFCKLESPTNHLKFRRQLATMINGNTEEWDCAMFFYAILYSDCLRHGVIEQVHSAVDDLRMLRNKIAHWPQAYVSYPDLSSICIRAEAAFESLNLPTIPLQIIRQKVHFSSGSTKELAFLQFIEECTPEQVDYFRLCYLVFDVVPRGLRVIFKREWDIRFKEMLGEWLDTPENGREFCKSARPDGQRRYLLATMVNGNREEWDSTMLFYAILQSKSIGSFLSLSVRLPVTDLREVRNETVKNVQGRLQAAEFERIVQKVQVAFETLDLSTSPIKDMMQQRMMRQQSGLPYVEGEVAKKQLQSVEYEHEKDVSSFCRLPFKPPIEIIGRDSEKEKILQELKTLKRNNVNSLSCLIISGRPGSGKSQLARQVAESFYDDATKVSDAPAFVMLLNAESSESLLESYISFSQQIKCSEIEVSNILVSEEITSDEKIIRLKNLIQERIHLYTTWLLVIDNVTGVRSILNSVPEVGNPQWKMGQLLITTRDTVGPELAVDSFTCHISISQGMEPGDAISLLAAVSGADDKEMLAKVAKELDYQPLALVTAATCVKHDCRSSKEPNLAWTEILNHLTADKEMVSVSGDVSTPESSVLKSTDAVVCLAVESLIRTNEVIKYVLTCLSLFKPQEFDLDTLITYVQIVDLQHKKEITKTSESQIKECPLLLLGEEANNVRIGVHQVVLNGIKSALLEKRLPASSEVLAAVKLIHQMEIDPFEERRDELVFDDRIIPLLPS